MILFLCTFVIIPVLRLRLRSLLLFSFLSAFVKCLASYFTNRYAFPSLRIFYLCFVMLHMCVCVR